MVIDGQQRLMSIYYFIKQRFPKKEKRLDLRRIFDEKGHIPEEILDNDDYFTDFKLYLPAKLPKSVNKFHGSKYKTLGENKQQFELRPIRNVVVKQNLPAEDNDSSIYEIFNRLNSGGINLAPQEIRVALYHSKFYDMLNRLNILPEWRRILGISDLSLHMKDIEVLLRGFAMLIEGDKYTTTSLKKFLNQFSKKCKHHKKEQNEYLERLFQSFLKACQNLSKNVFLKKNRFNIALFETVFAVTCKEYFLNQSFFDGNLVENKIEQLKTNQDFLATLERSTTNKENIKKRLECAKKILS